MSNNSINRESETAAMMSWTAENKFVASLVLQDGFVGVTFPYYYQDKQTHHQGSNIKRDAPNETPDEDVFRSIATNIIGQNLKYSARNISCYYKAESGVENGYRMSDRYRKESLHLFVFLLFLFKNRNFKHLNNCSLGRTIVVRYQISVTCLPTLSS